MAGLSRRRVLVVEDEAAIALDLARLLRDHGAIVIGPAGSSEEAVAHIVRTEIDCALLDVKLGSDDCGMVAEILTRIAVPFVFVTGYSNSAIIQQYSRMPAVTKPYSPADVIDSLKAVLAAEP